MKEAPLYKSIQAYSSKFTKIGVVLLILGAMHFFNMYVLTRMRNRARQEELLRT